jgi:hypothetical protein
LVAVTVNVDDPPAVIEAGLAVMVTVGAAGGVTAVTVTVAVAETVAAVPDEFVAFAV